MVHENRVTQDISQGYINPPQEYNIINQNLSNLLNNFIITLYYIIIITLATL